MRNNIEENEFRDELVGQSKEAAFLRYLALTYHALYATGLAIVGNREDAEDVIQEVCIVLWQKFDEFDEEADFKKWACGITFNVAKSIARKVRRRRGFGFSEYALMKLSQTRSAGEELFDLQCEFLRQCIDRLPAQDREFLSVCYHNSSSLTAHAREIGRPVDTLYTRLKRLRKKLSECVTRKLGKE